MLFLTPPHYTDRTRLPSPVISSMIISGLQMKSFNDLFKYRKNWPMIIFQKGHHLSFLCSCELTYFFLRRKYFFDTSWFLSSNEKLNIQSRPYLQILLEHLHLDYFYNNVCIVIYFGSVKEYHKEGGCKQQELVSYGCWGQTAEDQGVGKFNFEDFIPSCSHIGKGQVSSQSLLTHPFTGKIPHGLRLPHTSRTCFQYTIFLFILSVFHVIHLNPIHFSITLYPPSALAAPPIM